MLKIVSIAVLVALGLLGYSLLWSYAFALLNEPNTFLVGIGVLLIGILIGLTIWLVVRFGTILKPFIKEYF